MRGHSRNVHRLLARLGLLLRMDLLGVGLLLLLGLLGLAWDLTRKSALGRLLHMRSLRGLLLLAFQSAGRTVVVESSQRRGVTTARAMLTSLSTVSTRGATVDSGISTIRRLHRGGNARTVAILQSELALGLHLHLLLGLLGLADGKRL